MHGRTELQRSPHVVCYWREGALVMHNYALDRTVAAQPLVVEVLEQFQPWTLLEHVLSNRPPHVREALTELVGVLVRDRWLLERGEPLLPGELAMNAWDGWNPAAGFFHSLSRDPEIVGLRDLLPGLSRKAISMPMPSVAKEYPAAARVRLPRRTASDPFTTVLRERRTWRRFGAEPIELEALAVLLDLSAGVQDWADAESEGRVALKTSPSGGARHPVELYVAARAVRGLEPGFYHFASTGHALERVSGAVPPDFNDLLPEQPWYRAASALVFFTALFERTRWRYNGPRAYRAVLLEAGHVCQTFCLTATSLGLAPFCSMALADSAIERAIGVDGLTEAVLYAAGVGTRPTLSEGQLPGALPEYRLDGTDES